MKNLFTVFLILTFAALTNFKAVACTPNGSTVNGTICGSGFFSYNGFQYTSPGTFYDTLLNFNGCDSVIQINVALGFPSNSYIQIDICNNSTYYFNGQILSTTGLYYDTLVNYTGCDSFVTIFLKVLPPIFTIVNYSMCTGDSVYFAGAYQYNSGIYLDTFLSAKFCDSVVQFKISLMNPNSSYTAASVCKKDTFYFNGQAYYHMSGVFIDTLKHGNIYGCDSIIVLNLTLLNSSSSSVSPTICKGSSYVFFGTPYYNSGVYVHTLTNAAGCDSVITLHLNVASPDTVDILQSICTGDTLIFNGHYVTQGGVYTDTLTNSSGCDSLIKLHLSLLPSSSSSLFVTVCHGDAYNFYGTNVSTPGNYTQHFVNSVGCDSAIVLTLSNYPVGTSSSNAAICAGQSFAFYNQTLTQSGVYSDTLVGNHGCDSIVHLVLTVSASINTNVTLSGNTLTAATTVGSIQWVDCTNFQPLAISNTFTPTVSGSYAAIITYNNCSDTSTCYPVSITGTAVLSAVPEFNIYPNPTHDVIFVDDNQGKLTYIQIFNELGQSVMLWQAIGKAKYELNLSSLPTGIYYAELHSTNSISRVKVQKW